jgi:serine/threonine-protein kinase
MAERFGRYRVVSELGTAGLAAVHLGVAPGPLQSLVRIYRLRAAVASAPGEVERFDDAAQLAARFDHAGIAAFFEQGLQDGVPYYVTEYTDGQPLTRLLPVGGRTLLPHSLLCWIVAEALEALTHAHDTASRNPALEAKLRWQLHPRNIWVGYDGSVKLCDLAVAPVDDGAAHEDDLSYGPPEPHELAQRDPRVDIFGLGVVLWEITAKRRLLSTDWSTNVRLLVTETIQPLSSLVAGVPAAFEAIVQRALDKDPDVRYPTPAAMLAELRAYLATLGPAIGADAVAARMRIVFEAEREKLLASLHEAIGPAPGEADPAEPEPRDAPSARTFDAPYALTTDIYDVSPKARNRTRAIGVGLVLGLLVLGFVIGRVAHVGQSLPPPVAAAEARPAAPPPPPPPPRRADQPETGEVRIVTRPSDADVAWHGEGVGRTPLRISAPVGEQTFVISLEGYETQTVRTTIDADRTEPALVDVELHALPDDNATARAGEPPRARREPRPAALANKPAARRAPPVPAAPRSPTTRIIQDETGQAQIKVIQEDDGKPRIKAIDE